MSPFTFLVTLIVIFPTCVSGNINDSVNTEMLLRSRLLSPSVYDPVVLPRKNTSNPLVVKFKLTLVNIMEYSEIESKFSLAGIISLSWKDDYLTWNSSEYNGRSSIYATGKEIWTPDSFSLLNGLSDDVVNKGIGNNVVRITSNGNVLASITGGISISCGYKPDQFPFDCQICMALFTMNTYRTNEVYSILDTPGIIFASSDTNTSNAMWLVTDIRTKNDVNPITGGIAYVYFELKRKTMFYTLNLIIPNTILSFLVILSYLIPVDQGEKISFGITIFLTYIVFMTQIDSIIPKTSDSSTAIGNYFTLLMISSTVGIANSVLTTKLPNDINTKVLPLTNTWENEEKIPPSSTSIFLQMRNIPRRKIMEYMFFLISLILIITANGILVHTYLNPVCG